MVVATVKKQFWAAWVYEWRRLSGFRLPALSEAGTHLTARLGRDGDGQRGHRASTGTSTTAAARPSCPLCPTICADLYSRTKKPSTIMILETLLNTLIRVWEYLTFWWYYPPALSNMRLQGPARDGDENPLMVSGCILICCSKTDRDAFPCRCSSLPGRPNILK